jgi:hypothetical protein
MDDLEARIRELEQEAAGLRAVLRRLVRTERPFLAA